MENLTDMEWRRYGPYLIYRNATIIDVRTGKRIKPTLKKGRYYVGLRMDESKKKTRPNPLLRILYKTFIDDAIGPHDYIVPKDGNYLNYDIDNLQMITASEFNETFNKHCGRKRVVTRDLYKKILFLNEKGLSLRSISKICKLSTNTVSHMLRNGFYGEKENAKQKNEAKK